VNEENNCFLALSEKGARTPFFTAHTHAPQAPTAYVCVVCVSCVSCVCVCAACVCRVWRAAQRSR
jgi:hypothetical protein